jgi:tetratricopeptide (TPR) repeat protein
LKKDLIKILIALACICCKTNIDAQEYSSIAPQETDSVSALENEKHKLLMYAKQLSSTNDIHTAAELYRKAIDIDPKCDACYYELANILIMQKQEQEAKDHAATAYRLDPTNIWFTFLYGRLCLHLKDYGEAIKLFRQISLHQGKKQEIWFGLAAAYEGQKMLPEALDVLDSMILRFGDNDDVSYRIFNISMDLGNYDRAIIEINKLIKSYPDDPRLTTLLADTYAEMGQDSLAINTYDRTIETHKSFAPALLGKAEAFRKKGRFTKYFAALQQYVANRSIEPEAKAEYLRLLMEIPSFATHFKHNMDTIFAILAVTHPVAMDLKFLQARYFATTQRPELSISVFGQLTDMDSNNKNAWINLLALEYGLKMFIQLEQSSQKAIVADPKYATFYMYSALALMAQKKTKQAINVLKEGIETANYDSVFMDNAFALLGDMYFSLNKSKKAFKFYEKALSINPNNATVLNNYAYYMSLLKTKNLDKAFAMSKKAIELEDANSSFLDTYAYILFLQGKYSEARAIFRKALAVGGDESAVVLEHYADTLDKLGERTIAELYWSQALEKPDCVNPEQIKKKLKGY